MANTGIEKSLARYYKWLEENGYIAEDGRPLKCIECGANTFTTFGERHSVHGLEEYSLRCQECGSTVGTWSYGAWQLSY